MKVSEYDAFGPWIYEITEEHPLPPLFTTCISMDEPCLYIFKIPREIERRRATPDMDLYDYVVGAYENQIRIYQRKEHTVEKSVIYYKDIEGIRIFERLLQGLCIFYMKDGQKELPFNTTSADIIMKFTTIIRKHYLPDSSAVFHYPENMQDIDTSDIDVLLVNLMKDVRENGETVTAVASQSTHVICAKNETLLNRLAHLIYPEKLSGTLFLLSPREFILLQAGSDKIHIGIEDFGYSYTYLPYESIKDIAQQESTPYKNTKEVTFKLSSQHVSLYLQDDNNKAGSYYDNLKTALYPEKTNDN